LGWDSSVKGAFTGKDILVGPFPIGNQEARRTEREREKRERKETTAMAEEDAAAATAVVVAMANNNNRTKDHIRNSVVDFLLHENYLLTAFELLHELQEDGLVEVEAATKLQLFFANSQMFPPDELAKMQALHGTLLSFKKK
jgi:hypothetical protein